MQWTGNTLPPQQKNEDSEIGPIVEMEIIPMTSEDDMSSENRNGYEQSSILNGSLRSRGQISVNQESSNSSRSVERQNPDQQRAASIADDARFHAFPESKWFRSVVFAKFGFIITTLMVLGNLMYTYVPVRIHDLTRPQNCGDGKR